jgi:O-antigen/teichoic acid export membrane protein
MPVPDGLGVSPRPPSIRRSAFWRIFARVLSSLGLGLTLLLMARSSAVSDFGEFTVAGAVAMITGIVLGFGAPTRALRSSAEEYPHQMARSLYFMHLGINCAVLLVMLAGAAIFRLPAAAYAGLAWGVGDTLQTYAQGHLAGLGRHNGASWLVVTQRIVPAVTLMVLVVSDRPADYRLIAIAFAMPAVVGALAPLLSVRGVSGDYRGVTRGVFSWWAFSLSAILLQLQSPLLATIASTTVVGLYGLSSRVLGPILLLPASLATVLIPELARRFKTGGVWILHRTFSKVTLAYAIIAIACAWPVGVVVTKIAGPEYATALPIVAGMVVAAGLSGYSQSYNALLVAAGHPNRAAACITVGQVLALLVLAALAMWGPTRLLGLAPITAELVVLVGMMFAVRGVRRASVAT